MGADVDLERLYRRNAPVPAGRKVDRAVQLIRFCGSVYRDLRRSYPTAKWDQSLAIEVQRVVIRARDSLDLPRFAFLSGDEDPRAPWMYANCVLESRAAARAAQLGHLEDVLIAGSLLSNGFHEYYSDDPTPSLPEGYCILLPMLAVMTAPLADVARITGMAVPNWFDYNGEEEDPTFDPAVAALRPDADSEFRRSLLEDQSPSTRDAILTVRASLGLPLGPDEVRGDMRAMVHFMARSEESGSDTDFRWVRGWLCLIYLAARDAPILLAPTMKGVKKDLAWLRDWYGVLEWPPFPSSRDPELPRLPATPSAVPIDNGGSAFGSAAALLSAAHYQMGEPDEARAWALVAAGMSVQQGFLLLAQLASDDNDPASAAHWAERGLDLPVPGAEPEPHLDAVHPDNTPASELHLLAAVSLARMNRVEESARHLVAAASEGNHGAQAILDAMINETGEKSGHDVQIRTTGAPTW